MMSFDRKGDRAPRSLERSRTSAGSSLVVGADRSVEQDVLASASSAPDALGKVDILINNTATICPKTRAPSGSPELTPITTALRDIVSIVDRVDVPISAGTERSR